MTHSRLSLGLVFTLALLGVVACGDDDAGSGDAARDVGRDAGDASSDVATDGTDVMDVGADSAMDTSTDGDPDTSTDASADTSTDTSTDTATDVMDASTDAGAVTVSDLCLAEYNRQLRCGEEPSSLDACVAECARPRADLLPNMIACVERTPCRDRVESCRTLEGVGATVTPAFELYQRACLAAASRCGRTGPVPTELCNMDTLDDAQVERLSLCFPGTCGEHADCLENALCAGPDSGAAVCLARQQRATRCRTRPSSTYEECLDSFSCVPTAPGRATAQADCIDDLSCADAESRCDEGVRPPAVVALCERRLAECGGFADSACDLELADDATSRAVMDCLGRDCAEVGVCVNELLTCRAPETLCDAWTARDERCGGDPRDLATCEMETSCVRVAARDVVRSCLNTRTCATECLDRPRSELTPTTAAVTFETRCRERAVECGLPSSLSTCNGAPFTNANIETLSSCFDFSCASFARCLGTAQTCSLRCPAGFLTPPFGGSMGNTFAPFSAVECGGGAPVPVTYADCELEPTVILWGTMWAPSQRAASQRMGRLHEDPRFRSIRFMEYLQQNTAGMTPTDADCAGWRASNDTSHSIIREPDIVFDFSELIPFWIVIDDGVVVFASNSLPSDTLLLSLL